MNKYAEQALLEYNSEECSPRPGGIDGRPFWNVKSTQFMYAPVLEFSKRPDGCSYLYTVTDKGGKAYSLKSNVNFISLAPVWGDVSAGFIEIKAEATDGNGNVLELVGERKIYKSAPFPGRQAYEGKARSYRECALKAFRFVYEDPMVQYWLKYGVPEPDYAHNAYPSKTISSLIKAMVYYAKLEPSAAQNAIKLAVRAADYLLSITPTDGPLAYLPPTYSFDGLNAESVNRVAPAAEKSLGTTMMIYPLSAGLGFLTLFDATGDKKYYDAALRIAEFYKNNVLPCGSWYLLYDCSTGKPLSENICVDFKFTEFFRALYEKTGDNVWHKLEISHFDYIIKSRLESFNWEGQFEDVNVSCNYTNLTHFTTDAMINYIASHLSHDKKMVATAKELMRYVEDQFVLWGEYPMWEWRPNKPHHTPAGLEQYFCYDPICSSTSTIMDTFISMYRLTDDRLYLEKALTLADMITRMQVEKDGKIPTFWIGENCEYGHENFWINCQIGTAFLMMQLAEFTEAEGIE